MSATQPAPPATPDPSAEPIPLPQGFTSAGFEFPTSLGPILRRVVRYDAPGPTVILIHEAPGITASTFAIADVLIRANYRVVMPVILDAAWSWRGKRHTAANMIKLCVARELSALATGRTGAIVEWLRGLADAEHATTAGRPVGVIGMCFSGGFALGTITNPHVSAAVLSQPALPFVFLPWKTDLGVSAGDLSALHDAIGTGGCIRAMRFSRDSISPRRRMKCLHREFPAIECVEIPTTSRRMHSVLARAVDQSTSGPTRVALDQALVDTLAFLERHLRPG